MSAQRRESHPIPTMKIDSWASRNRWQRRSCTRSAKVSGHVSPAPVALHRCAFATAGTAPRSAPNWAVTDSLQSDHSYLNFVTPASFFQQSIRHGSPPPGVGFPAASGTLTTRRLSLPFIPSPSGFADFHPALPQFPALNRRWTERYDGKRDMHFQHAA
jgi:hypothetical protein